MKHNYSEKVNIQNIKSYKIVEIINDRYYAVECTVLDNNSTIVILMEKEKFQQFRNKIKQKVNEDWKSTEIYEKPKPKPKPIYKPKPKPMYKPKSKPIRLPNVKDITGYQILKKENGYCDVEFFQKKDSEIIKNIPQYTLNSFLNDFKAKDNTTYFIFAVILFIIIFGGLWAIPDNKSNDNDIKTTKYSPNSVEKAFVVCSYLTSIDDRISCDVSGFNSSIDVNMYTSKSEAELFCTKISYSLLKNNHHFSAGWEIRVFSPLNDNKPIARCFLPN